ncbi:MAG: glycoside hydrolase family 2, partial [Proteiniphilum sp.]|nr:glycoside hydrolase family 2 [Proteiniphilum sp.]
MNQTRKYLFILLSFALLSSPLWAQDEWEGAWNDVTVTQINREEAHTLAIPFATEEDVRNNNIEQSPYFL